MSHYHSEYQVEIIITLGSILWRDFRMDFETLILDLDFLYQDLLRNTNNNEFHKTKVHLSIRHKSALIEIA